MRSLLSLYRLVEAGTHAPPPSRQGPRASAPVSAEEAPLPAEAQAQLDGREPYGLVWGSRVGSDVEDIFVTWPDGGIDRWDGSVGEWVPEERSNLETQTDAEVEANVTDMEGL